MVVNKEKATLADKRDSVVLAATLLSDRNNALGLESAREAAAGAARERDAAREEGMARLVEAVEAAELNLRDAARRREEAGAETPEDGGSADRGRVAAHPSG